MPRAAVGALIAPLLVTLYRAGLAPAVPDAGREAPSGLHLPRVGEHGRSALAPGAGLAGLQGIEPGPGAILLAAQHLRLNDGFPMAGGPLSPLEHKASDWDISTGGWCVRELISLCEEPSFS